MLDEIKRRCGIAKEIRAYDEEIEGYIEDAMEDMEASGVPQNLLEMDRPINPQVLTATTLYVKAYLGDDRSDTEKYLDLYREKVFRLTLEGDEEECGAQA